MRKCEDFIRRIDVNHKSKFCKGDDTAVVAEAEGEKIDGLIWHRVAQNILKRTVLFPTTHRFWCEMYLVFPQSSFSHHWLPIVDKFISAWCPRLPWGNSLVNIERMPSLLVLLTLLSYGRIKKFSRPIRIVVPTNQNWAGFLRISRSKRKVCKNFLGNVSKHNFTNRTGVCLAIIF